MLSSFFVRKRYNTWYCALFRLIAFGYVFNFSAQSFLAQSLPAFAPLYTSQDLTAEHRFSKNIEGPVTDGRGRLFVVNVERDGTIGLVHPNGRCEVFCELPPGSTGNSLRFGKRGELYVADFTGHNVLRIDTTTRTVSVYAHSPYFNQPNDLCIRRNGQLFASDPHWKSGTGKLWRIDPDLNNTLTGIPVLLDSTMGTTNGITLSPDATTLYVNESTQRRVWKYAVSKRGNLSRKTLFLEFTDGGLDGMKCDTKGNLYITRYGTSIVQVFTPAGKLLRELHLKGKDCSNLTFGGTDGKTVFVTLQDRKCVEMLRVAVSGKQ